MSTPDACRRDRIGGGRAVARMDGKSFYCACERVFDPKLAGVPVIVLEGRARRGVRLRGRIHHRRC
ncbi:hypothetical protein R1A27_09395 [Methylobacterium sp. NMS12]